MLRSNLTERVPGQKRPFISVAVTVGILAIALVLLNLGGTPPVPDPQEPTETFSQASHDVSELSTSDADSLNADASSATQASVAQVDDAKQQLRGAAAGTFEDENRKAIALNLALLEKGYETLSQTTDYTATFLKQERIEGELWDQQVMELKLRHQPFSVYLKSLTGDPGREVLYVEGQNDDKLLFHYGGWKAIMLPTLRIDPNGMLALRENRHPITKAGILELTRELIGYRRRDLAGEPRVRCCLETNYTWDDRDCYRFEFVYDSQSVSEIYRKSVQFIDKKLSLPVFIKNYTWLNKNERLGSKELDAVTFIEQYAYSNLQLDANLAEMDFDQNNSEYKFRR